MEDDIQAFRQLILDKQEQARRLAGLGQARSKSTRKQRPSILSMQLPAKRHGRGGSIFSRADDDTQSSQSLVPQELEFGVSHFDQLRYLKDYFNKAPERERRIKLVLATRRLKLTENSAAQMPSMHSLKVMFPNVIELNLADNLLSTIEAHELVKCLPQLEVVNVARNRLNNFEEVHALDKLEKLRSLDIRDNPSLTLSLMTRVAQLSALILRDAGADRSSPAAYQRALMARYANDAEAQKAETAIKFTTSVFRGKIDAFAPRLSMCDFIARQRVSAVEETIERRFSESHARTPRLSGKFRYLTYYNGQIIRVRDLQTTNFFERFPKDAESERGGFLAELKASQEQWQDPAVYLRNKPRAKRKNSADLWRQMHKHRDSDPLQTVTETAGGQSSSGANSQAGSARVPRQKRREAARRAGEVGDDSDSEGAAAEGQVPPGKAEYQRLLDMGMEVAPRTQPRYLRKSKSQLAVGKAAKAPIHVQMQKDEFDRQNSLVKRNRKEIRGTLESIKQKKCGLNVQAKLDEETAKVNRKMESGIENMLRNQSQRGGAIPARNKRIDMDHELDQIVLDYQEVRETVRKQREENSLLEQARIRQEQDRQLAATCCTLPITAALHLAQDAQSPFGPQPAGANGTGSDFVATSDSQGSVPHFGGGSAGPAEEVVEGHSPIDLDTKETFMSRQMDHDSEVKSASFKGTAGANPATLPSSSEEHLPEDLAAPKDVTDSARKLRTRHLFRTDIARRMQVGRDFQRAGTVIKPRPLESIPVIQIAASTLGEDIAKWKRQRLYEAVFSKNKMKKKRQKKINNKLQGLRKDVALSKTVANRSDTKLVTGALGHSRSRISQQPADEKSNESASSPEGWALSSGTSEEGERVEAQDFLVVEADANARLAAGSRPRKPSMRAPQSAPGPEQARPSFFVDMRVDQSGRPAFAAQQEASGASAKPSPFVDFKRASLAPPRTQGRAGTAGGWAGTKGSRTPNFHLQVNGLTPVSTSSDSGSEVRERLGSARLRLETIKSDTQDQTGSGASSVVSFNVPQGTRSGSSEDSGMRCEDAFPSPFKAAAARQSHAPFAQSAFLQKQKKAEVARRTQGPQAFAAGSSTTSRAVRHSMSNPALAVQGLRGPDAFRNRTGATAGTGTETGKLSDHGALSRKAFNRLTQTLSLQQPLAPQARSLAFPKDLGKTAQATSAEDGKRREKLYAEMDRKRKQAQLNIGENRREFKEHIRFATELMKQSEKRGDKRKKEQAWKVLTTDILGMARTYKAIETPEMRLKYLNLCEEGTLFADVKDSLTHFNAAIEEMLHFAEDVPQSLSGVRKSYEDVIASYLNCLQNDYDKADLRQYSKLIRRFYPPSHAARRCSSKAGIMEKIRNEFSSKEPPASKGDLARDLLLLKLHELQADTQYEKKNSMALAEEARIKAWQEGRIKLKAPIGGETLSEKKQHLKESLEDKKMANKMLKKQLRKAPVKVSDPPAYTPAQLRRMQQQNEDAKSKAIVARTQRNDSDYNNRPSLVSKSRSAADLLRRKPGPEPVEFVDNPAEVPFQRLAKLIEAGMSYENLRKHGNIIDKEEEIGKMVINEGSMIEYIPNYNDMFNKRKQKIFPLQRLEEIVADPSKYNHTKQVIKEQNRVKKLIATQKMKETDLKPIIGSKYRFQKSTTTVGHLDQKSDDEVDQFGSDEDPDSYFDLELYFDMKRTSAGGQGKLARSSNALSEAADGHGASGSKPHQNQQLSKSQVLQRHAHEESMESTKRRIDKAMIKEYLESIEGHRNKMIRRIVRYAADKHKNPAQ